MNKYALDTGALALFFARDDRVARFFRDIQDGRAVGLVTSVNLAEFHYKVCQTLGRDVATLRCRQLRALLSVVETDEELSLEAGLRKCRNSALSLADCFVLATAEMLGAALLTTDEELAKTGDVKVHYFGI